MLRKIWIVLIVFVPLIPKVAVVPLGTYTAILLDDVVLLSAIILALTDLLISTAKTGTKLSISKVGLIFFFFFLYKLTNLFVLSLVYPIGGLEEWGKAVMLGEGIMVLGRNGVMLCVYLLFFHYLRSVEDIRYVLKIYMASVFAIVFIALGQHFYLGHPVVTATFRNIYALSNVTLVWGTEDPWFGVGATGHEHLGGFMIMAIAIIGGMILHELPKEKMQWLFAMVLWLSGFLVLLLSSSRGAWIGALSAVGMAVWLALKKRMTRYIFRGGLILAIGLLALDWMGFDFSLHIFSRVEKLPSILEGHIEDDSAKHRIHLLRVLLDMFADKMMLGWGAGGAARIAEGQIQREMVEGGIIGLALFIAVLVSNHRLAVKSGRIAQSRLARGLSFGFICGSTGIIVQSLFTELFILPKVIIPFWLFAASVHRLYFLERAVILESKN